ncbi:MAG TPA: tetrathionate reductase family octaheme c-type cytochrome [Noviherbaspirillum sp.]|uniref:tetrathionate reductase family octaheme c-type cytochrome n=1 Tax=Noviherbaspirillum sp. TaxID=1926288 RepID=UPI002B4845C8|nr:tetrathionate reductase family octaheme c-type cytochrome [Noviherbaspirillum sp.]HJV85249.1 tetrathionate reductase family octaheme c-type cytochrome [Noviherbaspirillum sp.]
MRIRALTVATGLAMFITLAQAASGLASKLSTSTADHSKFTALQQDFKSGPEVTRACLTCHTEAAKQVHATQHWKWEYRNPGTRQVLGKRHIINNFCTSAQSNLASCASCHIGYGMKDGNFDFTSEENVDCLVCHDNTGKYKKPGGLAGNVVTRDTEFPPGSGKIIKGLDLKQIAQRVGNTRRETCGACHFYGGGGDGVKHGDLDSSLEAPGKVLDVHMDRKGNNFTCATCHKTEAHQVPGSRYAPTAMDKEGTRPRGKTGHAGLTTCQSCHGQAPHEKDAKLNDHTDKIACQTCHIPSFARGGVPTKLSWDWSTAGKRGKDGKPLVVKNDDGYDTYMGIKGDFVWGEDVKPEYIWFNGTVKYTLPGDRIEKTSEPVQVNRFEGSPADGKSMIWPVKVFRGKQAYDPVNKTLVVTHLAGNDDTAYWTNLDWEKAVSAGMAAVNAPFSGKVDFIRTESTWPITHMVAPKGSALSCVDCHATGGRLENISGIYIPGRARDHAGWLDGVGWAIAALALAGVLLHGLGRIVAFMRRK